VSARGSPAHPRPARVPSAGSSCGRSVRYRIQVPGPGPLLPAAPRRALSEHPGHPARLSAIPHAPFGGGPHPLTSSSLASNDSPPAPRHTASSHYIWPTVTPRIDPRAERRHPCAPRPPNHARRSNWRRLPAQNWRSFLDRYQCVAILGFYACRRVISPSFAFDADAPPAQLPAGPSFALGAECVERPTSCLTNQLKAEGANRAGNFNQRNSKIWIAAYPLQGR
jgi:hypothetical protein